MDRATTESTYKQLTGEKPGGGKQLTFNDALLAFQKLNIRDPKDPVDRGACDKFFGTYGVGNFMYTTDRPYERFACYECLLHVLRDKDSDKFRLVHKGTPYYFLAWTAFELRDYERAVFYMDAALSEDVRALSGDIGLALTTPGGRMWQLESRDCEGHPSPAGRITSKMRNAVESTLAEFGRRTGVHISIENFINKFVIDLIKDCAECRSVVTALYSFILEYEDRLEMMNLRSSGGGSIEPVLTHLFKGALIFETLMKFRYPRTDRGELIESLGGLQKNHEYRRRGYPELRRLSARSFEVILRNLQRAKKQNSQLLSFRNTTRIRNMSGHSLIWLDVFQKPENYKRLHQQEINAILYAVKKEFCDGR